MADENKATYTIQDNVLKGKEVPLQLTHYSVGHCVLEQLEKDPDFIGQIDAETDQRYTFAEMRELSVRCALWLLKEGYGHGDVIVHCSHNHMNHFVPFLATMYIGAVFNPWYHDMTSEIIKYFMQLVKPKVIFCTKANAAQIAEAAMMENVSARVVTFERIPGFECLDDVLQGHKASEIQSFRCVKVPSLEETFTILFSSGTTGKPKGVQLSHKSILGSISIVKNLFVNKQKTLNLWYSHMYWISAVMLSIMNLSSPSTILIDKEFDVEGIGKVIEKYKVTWLFLSTSMFHQVYKADVLHKYDFSSLKTVITGGAKTDSKALDYFRTALPNTYVCEAYGMTEMGGVLTSPSMRKDKKESCGYVSHNVWAKVVDEETNNKLGPNKVGELCFKSPYMMTGYYHNPEQTKNTIDKDGWLHSGDLGYYDEDGYIFIVDRKKEILKVKGHQVSPLDIETCLMQHPGVTEVAVVGVSHIIDNDHPVAFVSKSPGSEVTAAELMNAAAELGDQYKLRGGIYFLDKFPYTPSGKIDRKRLKEMAKSYAS